MKLTISIGDLQQFARGLREAPEYTEQQLLAAAHEATLLVQREWMENMPRVSGLTARSITSDVASTPTGVLGVVASSAPNALFLELGTRPHMPPVAAIEPWVRAVLGIREPKEAKRVAFLVARKIAREGTPAREPLGKAIAVTEAQVLMMFERAADRIVQNLAGAAA